MDEQKQNYVIVPVDGDTFITTFPDDDSFITVTRGQHIEQFKYNRAEKRPVSVGHGSQFGKIWAIADKHFRENPPMRKPWHEAKEGQAWLIEGKLADFEKTIEVVALVDDCSHFVWGVEVGDFGDDRVQHVSIFSDQIKSAVKMVPNRKQAAK